MLIRTNTSPKQQTQSEELFTTSCFLLKQDKPTDLLALYLFYYCTAKRQQTNQPKATTGFTAQGLQWSEERVRTAKKSLIALGLLLDIVIRDKESNKVIGHFVKVTLVEIDHTNGKPDHGYRSRTKENQTVENSDTNTRIPINSNTHDDKLKTTSSSINALFNAHEDEIKDKRSLISPKHFERFWSVYPKKTEKGKSKTEWETLCRKPIRPKLTFLLAAVVAQIATGRWQEKQFIPNPSTWIHQSRWLDDPAEMKGSFHKPEITGRSFNPTHKYRKADLIIK